MWQKYYSVKQWLVKEENLRYLSAHGKWFIFYDEDNASPNMCAYDVAYRTETLAIRGAERLYRRMHGAMEDAIFGPENKF